MEINNKNNNIDTDANPQEVKVKAMAMRGNKEVKSSEALVGLRLNIIKRKSKMKLT